MNADELFQKIKDLSFDNQLVFVKNWIRQESLHTIVNTHAYIKWCIVNKELLLKLQ